MTNTPQSRMWLFLPQVCMLLSGCATGKPSTWVESLTDPDDFHFVIVVANKGTSPGGWQAACVPFHIKRDVGAVFICKLGVELPIVNETVRVSIPLAKRIASDCANLAAQGTLTTTTPATDLRVACEESRLAYDIALRAAVGGSRVARVCDKKAERVLDDAAGP